MRTANLCATALFVGLLVPIGSAFGQHDFFRTKTVDLKTVGGDPVADFDNIQDAIDDVPFDPTEKWTILIYAGLYELTAPLTLDDQDENIDLVGIDRESVIISVSGTDKNGITITSGAETSRNNRIANLTIITTDGHGIEIVKPMGAQTPKDIEIEGVTILAAGTAKDGIEGTPADTVRIFDCNIESAAGHGVVVGDNYQIVSSSLRSAAAAGAALYTLSKDGLLVSNCTLDGDQRGLYVQSSLNIEVLGSTIQGVKEGVTLYLPGDNVRFLGCTILGDGNSSDVIGVYGDWNDPNTKIDPVFQSCRIEAIGGQNAASVSAVMIDNTEVQFIDCDFHATSLNNSQAIPVSGIRCLDESVVVIGGSIETSQPDPDFDKAIDVFDLRGDQSTSTPDHIFISRTRFSKWLGPINASGRPRSVMQRTIDVRDEVTDAIHASIDLTISEQSVTTGITDPDVYRVLSVTGNTFAMDQDVYIVGTDWADNVIVDKIKLGGTSTMAGLKPFKTVTKIIVPAQTSGGQSLTVGTTNKLGLYYPISADSDVIQESRLVSGVYTTQTVGTVDEVYATVVPSSITDGDSFEWALLTGQ